MLAQRIYMHEWARAQNATGLSLNTERAGIFADNINVDKEALLYCTNQTQLSANGLGRCKGCVASRKQTGSLSSESNRDSASRLSRLPRRRIGSVVITDSIKQSKPSNRIATAQAQRSCGLRFTNRYSRVHCSASRPAAC